MKLNILKKLLLLFCILQLCSCVYAVTVRNYNGGYTTTRTIYNPMNNTQSTVRINQQMIMPGSSGVVNSPSISTRVHNITPSVQYTYVPTPGYNRNIPAPHNQVYHSNMPASGIVINNANGTTVRYPVNNTVPYYGNGYYVNTVNIPVVTHTTTMTTGNGTYSYSEDYAPYTYNTTTYTNGRRFLSW